MHPESVVVCAHPLGLLKKGLLQHLWGKKVSFRHGLKRWVQTNSRPICKMGLSKAKNWTFCFLPRYFCLTGNRSAYIGNIIYFSSLWSWTLEDIAQAKSSLTPLWICTSLCTFRQFHIHLSIPSFIYGKLFLLKIQLAWISYSIKSQRNHN